MIHSIEKIAEEIDHWRRMFGNVPIIATSGGFDPLHVGHLRCIRAASEHREIKGLLIVIVNGDGFLQRKKGKAFMPIAERMEIIDGIRGVDHVVEWDDGSQTVVGALELLKPTIFAKGGDRSSADKVPEFEVCKRLGCEVKFGVGGAEKVQSSSDLLKAVQK